MLFSDLALSQRLERTEGYACVQFAEARSRFSPDSGAQWMEYAGAFAAFNGVDSPVTQSFGLGLFEPLSVATLEVIERFFFHYGASVDLEVSPLVGVAALNLLCSRGYRPLEISNVLYQLIGKPGASNSGAIRVRVTGPDEAELWAHINAQGWAQEYPELLDLIVKSGALISTREGSVCFIAEIDREPGAAGVLCLHEGVALFGGAATVPAMRRRGLQTALLDERMRYAFDHGCDLAMMVTEPGSNSQRNAERRGFRIAYTRTKWRLSCGAQPSPATCA